MGAFAEIPGQTPARAKRGRLLDETKARLGRWFFHDGFRTVNKLFLYGEAIKAVRTRRTYEVTDGLGGPMAFSRKSVQLSNLTAKL